MRLQGFSYVTGADDNAVRYRLRTCNEILVSAEIVAIIGVGGLFKKRPYLKTRVR